MAPKKHTDTNEDTTETAAVEDFKWTADLTQGVLLAMVHQWMPVAIDGTEWKAIAAMLGMEGKEQAISEHFHKRLRAAKLKRDSYGDLKFVVPSAKDVKKVTVPPLASPSTKRKRTANTLLGYGAGSDAEAEYVEEGPLTKGKKGRGKKAKIENEDEAAEGADKTPQRSAVAASRAKDKAYGEEEMRRAIDMAYGEEDLH